MCLITQWSYWLKKFRSLQLSTQFAGVLTGFKVPFLGSSVYLTLFQATYLVYEYLLAVLTDYITLEGKCLVNLASFRDFLELLSCFLPEFKGASL